MSETNNTFKSLSETFDVHDVIDVPSNEISVIEDRKPEESTLESDADAVRDTLYNILKQGEEAFEDLKRIAVAEESPRSFEVLNSMLGTLSDVSMKLMEVHEKKAKIRKQTETKSADAGAPVNNGTVNNNTVFVGTTAELQEMLKKLN